jgi:hypothetical protein
MAAAYPPGQTFFDTLKKSFVDVPVDESKDSAIPTTAFLEAAESLITLFDVLGSTAFKPVKSDMNGNIKVRLQIGDASSMYTNTLQKIRDRQLAAPALSETLQDLALNELKEKKHTATEGLVWLNRLVSPYTLTRRSSKIP